MVDVLYWFLKLTEGKQADNKFDNKIISRFKEVNMWNNQLWKMLTSIWWNWKWPKILSKQSHIKQTKDLNLTIFSWRLHMNRWIYAACMCWLFNTGFNKQISYGFSYNTIHKQLESHILKNIQVLAIWFLF